MPRGSASKKPQVRARCEHACDNCKRRKERCNGERPCAICVRRTAKCIYSDLAASVLQKATSKSLDGPVQLGDSFDPNDTEDAIDHVLNPPTAGRHAGDQGIASDVMQLEAPVPRVARLLRDGRGKFIYIGDSASLSFLQNVRRIVSSTLGECPFTTDRLRHSILEQFPPDEDANLKDAEGSRPDIEQARMLADRYVSATACLLDLFDPIEMTEGLEKWIEDPSVDSELSGSIFYLIMAIGAQVTAENCDEATAAHYFSMGRKFAYRSFTQEPSIQSVQCYALIAMYMLGACRRNASFMNLGIAVRAAYALGLHRNDILDLFSESEARSRERVWQTLRVLDLFLSASLGRPPATSDFEKDPVAGGSITSLRQTKESDETKFAAAVVNLCSIFERILVEVYKKRSVSTYLADDISRQYREWTAQLPNLQVPNKYNGLASELSALTASAHLFGAYHWSIILLTRPFLVFQVSLHQLNSQRGSASPIDTAAFNGSSIANFADACVDSAIKGIDIAEALISRPDLPRRLPFILNSVFNSALAIGLAFFGDFDRTFPLAEGMNGAERILETMRPHDPQARRFSQIVEYLSGAAKEYVRLRDRKLMQQRSSRVSSIFGTVRTDLTPSMPKHSKALRIPELCSPTPARPLFRVRDELAQKQTSSSQYHIRHQPSAAVGDFDYTTLTTSGLLISRPGSSHQTARNEAAHTVPHHGLMDPFALDTGSEAELMPMFNMFNGMDSIDWITT